MELIMMTKGPASVFSETLIALRSTDGQVVFEILNAMRDVLHDHRTTQALVQNAVEI